MNNDEIWKPVSINNRYEVSSYGRIRRVGHNIIKGSYNTNGYLIVKIMIDGKFRPFKIHRLVAFEFIPNVDNKPFIDHINGIRDDNRVENLRWCTLKENQNFPLAKKHLSESAKAAFKRPEVMAKFKDSMKHVYNDVSIRKRNSEHIKMLIRTGKLKLNKKRVVRISCNDGSIKEYSSLSAVMKDGYDPSFVCKVCKCKKRLAYGYKWEYKPDN